ncbi:MAG: tetratricopeptide repeat protein [Verrucomicrobia bacterium]|nr:tetratricopeptide repeat protein [Verrucomicrobiota bacterium]
MNALKFGSRERIFLAASAALILLLIVGFIQVRSLEKLLRADADFYRKAVTLYDQGNFAAAAPIFSELLRRDPNSWILAAHYGRCLGETGRYKEASVYCSRALELNVFLVRNGYFLVPWGYYSYLEGDYEKARVLLEASLKTKLPDSLATTARRLVEDIQQKRSK